jgi:hypothetical protein
MKVIRLAVLSDGDEMGCSPDASDAVACDLFWRVALAHAIREDATAVSFHPWRAGPDGEGTLTCTIADVRCDMVPPDPAPEFTGQLLAAARRLAATGPLARLWAWVTGGAVGRIRLVAAQGASDWCVVSWGHGRLAGVEFYRLSLAPAASGSQEAEPGAAADGGA